MIIWGTTGKEKRIGTENFYCPNCREETEGSHMRMSRYFTLYFIPLFPMDTLGDYIRCDECDGEFNMTVLDLTQEDFEAARKPWRCTDCGNTNPGDYDECISCGEDR
jgi:hypothetical protein